MTIRQVAGSLLILTALTLFLAVVLSDPGVESRHNKDEFIEQVENAAAHVPGIHVFQAVDVVRGFLSAAAGLALYLILRERSRVAGLAGLLMFAISGVFAASTAVIGAGMVLAAGDYVGEGLGGIGTGNDNVLEIIRVLSILHFGFFLIAFATLGVGVGAFSYGLAWSVREAPRLLGWLGLLSSGLLGLAWLALVNEILFVPFFVGGILSLIWLLLTGIWLVIRKVDLQGQLAPRSA